MLMVATLRGNKMSTKQHIVVIGSGLMGHGIAQIFAVHEHPVTIIDPNEASLATVHERIRTNLTLMQAHGISFSADIETILPRVRLAQAITALDTNVAFVFEAVFEEYGAKTTTLCRIGCIFPSGYHFVQQHLCDEYHRDCLSITT